MNITKQKDAGLLTVLIEGALDIRTAPELTKALEGELEDVNEVYFDLGKTNYTSSAGLRVLLKTFQVMEQKDGRMVLKNVNDELYDILKLSGFVDFLEIERE